MVSRSPRDNVCKALNTLPDVQWVLSKCELSSLLFPLLLLFPGALRWSLSHASSPALAMEGPWRCCPPAESGWSFQNVQQTPVPPHFTLQHLACFLADPLSSPPLPVVTLTHGSRIPLGTTPLGFPGRMGSPEACFCLLPQPGLPQAWNLTGYCNIVAE